MLYRIGNKQRLAEQIIQHFPKHEIYIEPFFGAGGIFFNKPKAKYNFVNDYNKDVFNLFMILQQRSVEFSEALYNLPIDQNLFNFWNKHQEINPMQKALRFVLLSNFSYLGQGNSFALLPRNIKSLTLSKIPKVNELLENVYISNLDFEKFLKSILLDNDKRKSLSFIYADPPYVNKTNNYFLKWTDNDTIRLLLVLTKLNIKFAVSESENNDILSLAKYYKLNIIKIDEVNRLSTSRKEILLTNY